MVALAHLKKFVEDHPQYFPDRGQSVMAQAESLAPALGARVMGSKEVMELLDVYGPEVSAELFELIGTDSAYIEIRVEAATVGTE